MKPDVQHDQRPINVAHLRFYLAGQGGPELQVSENYSD